MISMSTITPFLVVAFLLGALATTAQIRTGLPPQDAWTCPPSHPIKGNLTTSDQRGHARRKLRFRPSMCLNQDMKSGVG